MILATVLLALGVAAIVFGVAEGTANKPLSLFVGVPLIVLGLILTFMMLYSLERAMFSFDPAKGTNTATLLILGGLLGGILVAVAGIYLRRRLLHRQCGLRIWQ